MFYIENEELRFFPIFTIMTLIVFLRLFILLAAAKGQATDCDYNFVCDDTGSPGDLCMLAPSPLACYEACRDSTDVHGNPDCKFWTYYEELGFKTFRDQGTTRSVGHAVCRRLTDCSTTFPISSYCSPDQNRQLCASGPASCEPCDKCDKLSYLPGNTITHWTCDIDVPYRRENMPPDSVCRTMCPSSSWTVDGTTPGSLDAPVSVKSTCKSKCGDGEATGQWDLEQQDATINKNGDKPTPTVDAECLCENIVLGDNQLPSISDGSTMEVGAKFFCNDNGLIDDGTGIKNTMDSSSRCQLFCNGHLSMDIKCTAGYWSEGVKTNRDIYCWGEPLECTYNSGLNMDVCTCKGTGNEDVCTPNQGCDHGVCSDVCVESENQLGQDCFCASNLGGTTCLSGQICNNQICTHS